MGKVIDVDLFIFKANNTVFFKALIKLNASKPFPDVVRVLYEFGEPILAKIKYECLRLFCYYYGLIGHEKDVKATEGIGFSKEQSHCH